MTNWPEAKNGASAFARRWYTLEIWNGGSFSRSKAIGMRIKNFWSRRGSRLHSVLIEMYDVDVPGGLAARSAGMRRHIDTEGKI
jgi:hypothetical protein